MGRPADADGLHAAPVVHVADPGAAVGCHGPPARDSCGRLCVYTLASVGCTFAPNFATLLVFRALQGMSAGVGMIVGRAVIRDLFEGPQAQKLMSLVTMCSPLRRRWRRSSAAGST